jgi:D-alanine--poly(phosphoribitol) ligase subunit 1
MERPMNPIAKRLLSAASKYPYVTAYRTSMRSVSYSELFGIADRLSTDLNLKGTSPVIIKSRKTPETAACIIACVLSGRAYVPVAPDIPAVRLDTVISRTGSELMFDDGSFISVTKSSDTPDDTFEDTAYIIFTSGSTGIPKGVPISYGNLDNFITWISGLCPLESYRNTAVFNHASFSFDLSVAAMYYAWCGGHTLVDADTNVLSDYTGILDIFGKACVEVAVMTPTFANLCLLDRSFCAAVLPSLRCIYFCGEQLTVRTVERLWAAFPDLRIINAYGPTEATSAVCAANITPDMLTKPYLPIGTANGNAVDISMENGEIVLRGASVFRGYLGEEKAGCDANRYRTGDLGYTEGGYLYCTGRIDDQVKYKGYRIELSDIENNLNLIPGVRQSAVTAVRDVQGQVRYLKAFIAAEALETEAIRAALKETLPEYMIPKIITVTDKLPVTVNGKTDRKALT